MKMMVASVPALTAASRSASACMQSRAVCSRRIQGKFIYSQADREGKQGMLGRVWYVPHEVHAHDQDLLCGFFSAAASFLVVLIEELYVTWRSL